MKKISKMSKINKKVSNIGVGNKRVYCYTMAHKKHSNF